MTTAVPPLDVPAHFLLPVSTSKLSRFETILNRFDSLAAAFNRAKGKGPLTSEAERAVRLGHSSVVHVAGKINDKLVEQFRDEVIPPILNFIRQKELVAKTGLEERGLVVAFFIDEFEMNEHVNWDKTRYRDAFEEVLTQALELDVKLLAV